MANRKHKETAEYYRQEIVRLTDEANRRLKSYNQAVKAGTIEKSVLYENEIKELKMYSGSEHKGYILKNTRGKKVDVLYRQYRELNYFLDWDMTSPEGMAAAEERENQSYKEFISKAGRESYTKEEWRGLVEIFGAVGSEIVHDFGSEQIVELYKQNPTKRGNLVDAMSTVHEKNKGKQLSKTKLFKQT